MFWPSGPVPAGTPRAALVRTWSARAEAAATEHVETLGHGVQIVGKQPGVDVERHGRRGVPEHPLDHLHRGARGDGQGRSGVPQLVRGEPVKSDRRGGPVEPPPPEREVAQIPALRGRERQVAGGPAVQLGRQLVGQEPGERYLPLLVGLGGAEDEPALYLGDGNARACDTS